ncbi:hypothetical protein KEJ26_04580 [Candidatus Bathyarchaeota archaeon]|nr:hypothetical protein [Candidatus Bathyarchaeota archaeon]
MNKRSAALVILFALALNLCLYAHFASGVNLDKISLRPISDVPSSVAYGQTLEITLKGTKIYSDGSKKPLADETITCHIKYPDGTEKTSTKTTADNGYVTFTIGPLDPGQYQIWFDIKYKGLETYYATTDVFTVTWEAAPTTPGFTFPTIPGLSIEVALLIIAIIIIIGVVAILAKSGFLAKLRPREPLY